MAEPKKHDEKIKIPGLQFEATVPLTALAAQMGCDQKTLMQTLRDKGISPFRKEGLGWCIEKGAAQNLLTQQITKQSRQRPGDVQGGGPSR